MERMESNIFGLLLFLFRCENVCCLPVFSASAGSLLLGLSCFDAYKTFLHPTFPVLITWSETVPNIYPGKHVLITCSQNLNDTA